MPDWLSFEPFSRTASCAINNVIGKLRIPAGSMAQLQSSANYLIARQLSGGIIPSLLLFDIDGLSGKRLDKYAAMTTYEPGDKYMEGVAQQLMNDKINKFNKFLAGETK